MNGRNLMANQYVYTLLNGTLEIFSYFIPAPLLAFYGRKTSCLALFSLTGILLVSIVFLPKGIIFGKNTLMQSTINIVPSFVQIILIFYRSQCHNITASPVRSIFFLSWFCNFCVVHVRTISNICKKHFDWSFSYNVPRRNIH